MQSCDIPRWHIAKHHPKRMISINLIVSIRQDEQGGYAVDAATKVFQHVKRRLVGPMDIFNHQDRGTVSKFIKKGSEERGAFRLALKEGT
jgi:hypothetical protein